VRGIIIAISAKTTDPFSVNFRRNLTAPGEVRGCPPSFESCDKALPASEMQSAAAPAMLVCWGETNSTKNTSEGESQGKSDHRVLLRDADIAASTMPAAQLAAGAIWPVPSELPLPERRQQLPFFRSVQGQPRRFLGACCGSGLPPIADRCRAMVGCSSVPQPDLTASLHSALAKTHEVPAALSRCEGRDNHRLRLDRHRRRTF
jgi:hypothetical protein